MSFLISKLIIFLLKPILWVLVLLLFSWFSKNHIRKRRYFWAAVAMLLFFSNTLIIRKIYSCYEIGYPKPAKYDVGIVLGGFSSVNPNKEMRATESGDRLFQTLALYHGGMISKIMVSGGNGVLGSTMPKEALSVKDYLIKIGIPDSAIIVESKSRNTIENALFSRQLLPENSKVLMITSAWHAPRAKMIFSKVFKRTIECYPTDQLGKAKADWSDYIFPNASAINDWELLLKEWVGLLVDRFRV